jgi:hypothetical protein
MSLLVVTDHAPRSSAALEWLWQQAREWASAGLWLWESPAPDSRPESADCDSWRVVRMYPMLREGVASVAAICRAETILCVGAVFHIVADSCPASRIVCVWNAAPPSASPRSSRAILHVATSERIRRDMASALCVFDVCPALPRRPAFAWTSGSWPAAATDGAGPVRALLCHSLRRWRPLADRAGFRWHFIDTFDFSGVCETVYAERTRCARCVLVTPSAHTCLAALWVGVPVLALSEEAAALAGPLCGLPIPTSSDDIRTISAVAERVASPASLELQLTKCREGAARARAEAVFSSLESSRPRARSLLHLDRAAAQEAGAVGLVGTWDASGMGAQMERLVEALRSCGHANVKILAYTGYAADAARGGSPEPLRRLGEEQEEDMVMRIPALREQVRAHAVKSFCERFGVRSLLVVEPVRGPADEWIAGAQRGGAHKVALLCNAEWLLPGDPQRWSAAGAVCYENWRGAVRAFECAGVVGMGLRDRAADAFMRRVRRIEGACISRSVGQGLLALLVVGANPRRKIAPDIVRAFLARPSALKLVVSCWTDEWADPSQRSSARIEWHVGQLAPAELARLRDRCDVCVCLSAVEGLGMELYDACESGQLMLVHDKGPHRAFADEGSFGWVVPAQQADGRGVGDSGGELGVVWRVSPDDIANAFANISAASHSDVCAMLRRAAATLPARLRWSDFVQRTRAACD